MSLELKCVFDTGEVLYATREQGPKEGKRDADWQLCSEMAEYAMDFLSEDQIASLFYYMGSAVISPGKTIEAPDIGAELTYTIYKPVSD